MNYKLFKEYPFSKNLLILRGLEDKANNKLMFSSISTVLMTAILEYGNDMYNNPLGKFIQYGGTGIASFEVVLNIYDIIRKISKLSKFYDLEERLSEKGIENNLIELVINGNVSIDTINNEILSLKVEDESSIIIDELNKNNVTYIDKDNKMEINITDDINCLSRNKDFRKKK